MRLGVVSLVARVTSCRSDVPNVVYMASGAGCRSVSPSQRERRGRMVDRSPDPGGGSVALCTGLAHGRRMRLSVIGLMAGRTGGGRTFVDTVDMTGCAGRGGVSSCQREGRLGMVHSSLGPVGGAVAGIALLAVGPIVGVIFLMAGIAGGGCPVPDAVHMAGCAGHTGMESGQGERSCRMVDRSSGPGSGIVTLCAGLADGGRMRLGVVCLVACGTG